MSYVLTRGKGRGTRYESLTIGSVLGKLNKLFAQDAEKGSTRSYTDLVQERVVGIATVKDVVRFVAEGIRGLATGKDTNQVVLDHLGTMMAG